MKKLIITAHPSSRGFTHRIAKSYKKASEEAGHEVEILDLYKTELKQDYLKFENVKNLPEDLNRRKIQGKITEADELIFIHPLWWFTMPAIMKNFIDQNFTAGFAYKYAGKPWPVGLLKGKTARVFMTSDGPAIMYKFLCSPFKRIWKIGIMSFCGIKTKSFTHFDRMRGRSEEEKEKWLKKVYDLGRK